MGGQTKHALGATEGRTRASAKTTQRVGWVKRSETPSSFADCRTEAMRVSKATLKPASDGGRRVTSPQNTETIQRRARWSLRLPAVAVLVAMLFWWVRVDDAFLTWPIACTFAVVVACASVIVIVPRLVALRMRGAMSAMAAVAIIAGGIAAREPLVVPLVRNVNFAVYRSGYERTIKVWRSKNLSTVPFRLVLSMVDRSVFVGANVFDYIVYDQSDAIGKDPPVVSGVWLCAIPGWNREINMMMRWEVHAWQLSGHFYFVEQVG